MRVDAPDLEVFGIYPSPPRENAERPVSEASIEDAIREALARRGRPGQRAPPRLPVLKGRRLASGVDLDDSAGLLDLLEGPRAAR